MSKVYTCLRCGYNNKRKRNLKRHLLRKKVCKPIKSSISIEELLELQGFVKTKPIQNKDCKINEEQIYNCDYCKKKFSRKDNLKRHIDNWCKKINEDQDTIEMSKKEWKQVLEKHKIELTEQITESITDKLTKTLTEHISKQLINSESTNITNNTQNNNTIILNNYGNENKDYITENVLTYLVKRPGIAIRRLIEKMHFHPDHPENHNLKATSKRSDLVQVIENNKWQYRNRKAVISNLIENKATMLEEHYSKIQHELPMHKQYKFEQRINKVGECDIAKKNVELTILEESKNIYKKCKKI